MRILGISLIFQPLHASAAPAFVCNEFSAIEPPSNCDDNEQLTSEALSCVRNYYTYVQDAQKEILANFQAEVNKTKEEQSDTYNRSQSGYDETRRKLHALMEDGKRVRAAVDSLSDNLAFPEDYDQPGFTGMSQEQYLSTEECFAVATKIMGQSKVMVDKIMNDIHIVEQNALGKQNKSQIRSTRVQVIVPNQMAAKTKSKGVADFDKKKFRQPASDITGTDRERTDVLPPDPAEKK